MMNYMQKKLCQSLKKEQKEEKREKGQQKRQMQSFVCCLKKTKNAKPFWKSST